MTRLHVHVSVEDLEQSVGFYSALFGAQPTKLKSDYAKWMLDDPNVNFAISKQGNKPGVNHLGIQAESEEEMRRIRERISQTGAKAFDEGETTCCYAESDKSWVLDPGGVAWETYHTMADAQTYYGDPPKEPCSETAASE
jgi:predicted enzyme related to lactoylglutathione lyase